MNRDFKFLKIAIVLEDSGSTLFHLAKVDKRRQKSAERAILTALAFSLPIDRQEA